MAGPNIGSRKPHGFWKSRETIEILRRFVAGKITEAEATRQLRCGPGDVKYYARLLQSSPPARAMPPRPARANVVSLRLSTDVADRLQRLSRILARSVGETGAILLTEKLREEDFPFIEFRASPLGRQPHVKGTSLAIWEVVLLGRQFGLDPRRVADYLEWPEAKVRSALAYAEAYEDEVESLVDEADKLAPEELKRKIPWLREVHA